MSKKLIDKDALVAEIERKIAAYRKNFDKMDINIARILTDGKIEILKDILSFIDTLEEKEGDLENSMTCNVDWYDGFLLDYTQEQQDELLEKIGANVGDKVRIILIKE